MDPSPKTLVTGTIKVNAYRVVQEAVEAGLVYGFQRTFKHCDLSEEERTLFERFKESILEQQETAIMNELSDRLDFGSDA